MTETANTPEPADPMDETVYEVDETDTVVRAIRRGTLTDHALRHRSVAVLFRDAEGRVLVHRRAASKRVFPRHHDMFVAGMVPYGESYEEAAHRESAEEIGQRDVVLTLLGHFRYDDDLVPQCTMVYESVVTGPVVPQQSEVEWFGFLTDGELAAALGEWRFCPDSLAFYESLYLGRPVPALTRFDLPPTS